MANDDNLIPLPERTKDEQRAIRVAGGKASGRARLRKKHGRDLVRAILQMKEVDPRIIEELEKLGVDAKDMTNDVTMHIRQIEKAKRKADTNAYNAVNKAAGYTEDVGNHFDNVTIIVRSQEEKDKLNKLKDLEG